MKPFIRPSSRCVFLIKRHDIYPTQILKIIDGSEMASFYISNDLWEQGDFMSMWTFYVELAEIVDETEGHDQYLRFHNYALKTPMNI